MQIEIIVIASAGVWGKGETLALARAQARRVGPLGRFTVIVVAPTSAEATVDDSGNLCWKGEVRPRYVLNDNGKSIWPLTATLTRKARLAVEASIEALVCEVAP